jgi:hypothetical protein
MMTNLDRRAGSCSVLAILLCSVPTIVSAADDFKILQLEQEVRTLQREVGRLSRELEQLRSQPARPADPAPLPLPPSRVSAANNLWLDAAKWQQVKAGMSELQVISLLGPPTSMRVENQDRLLLYAMEIGVSGFLGGSVTLRNRAVADVKLPVLQ